MSAPELFLLIPGLFGPRGAGRAETAAAGLPARTLARLLARADAVPAGDAGLDGALFRLFGAGPGTARGDAAALPVAPLTLLDDSGAPPAGYWLRADPVHLGIGQETATLTGGDALQVGAEEAAALCAEVNGPLAAEGLRLLASAATRWYLSLSAAPDVRFSPLEEALGQDVRPHLPQGGAGREWRRRLNEIQMVLHASEVNRRRAARGLPEINSVWFWGGGVLPAAGACPYTHAWGDHALLRGLARRAGLAPRPLPEDANAWRAAAQEGRHLVLLDRLAAPARLGDVEAWRAGLCALLERWIDPLWPLLRRGRLGALAIGSAGALDYHINPKRARRWWRRAGPFTAYG